MGSSSRFIKPSLKQEGLLFVRRPERRYSVHYSGEGGEVTGLIIPGVCMGTVSDLIRRGKKIMASKSAENKKNTRITACKLDQGAA